MAPQFTEMRTDDYSWPVSNHYFTNPETDETQSDTKKKQRTVEVSARGRSLKFIVSDQVFSGSRLDPGTTQLLAKARALPADGLFLDLGCGWGPLALNMAAESPKSTVWAVDVNKRALELTAQNAKRNGLHNTLVFEESVALEKSVAEDVKFDVIWSNPPIRIGKTAMQDLLSRWLNRLSADGHACLVVNRHLGADSLATWLTERGWEVRRVASKKGYRILEVRHAKSLPERAESPGTPHLG